MTRIAGPGKGGFSDHQSFSGDIASHMRRLDPFRVKREHTDYDLSQVPMQKSQAVSAVQGVRGDITAASDVGSIEIFYYVF